MNLGQVKREWKPSTGADRYRRGLYTHLWRATPHPALAVFDGTDGFSTCTRRLRSNTPLQALTLLNDEQFYEFAQALAQRVQREATGDLAAQLTHAFRLCVARAPSATELARVTQLYREQLTAATGDEAARRGEAWTVVARVLLNLDEAITRE
jgi:DNA-binding phage protein